MDLKTNRINFSRDVLFHETTFPCSVPRLTSSSNRITIQNSSHISLPIVHPLPSILGPGPSSSNPSSSLISQSQSQIPNSSSPSPSAIPILTLPRSPIITRAHTNSSRTRT